MLLFGAGLLADGVPAFQSLKWLPFLTHTAWESQVLLTEDSVLGDILHSFFGYAQTPSVLQVSAYAVFLSAGVVAFLRRGRNGGLDRAFGAQMAAGQLTSARRAVRTPPWVPRP